MSRGGRAGARTPRRAPAAPWRRGGGRRGLRRWDRLRALMQRWQRPLLALASLLLLGWIAWGARRLDWAGAWQAMRALPVPVLAAALAVTLLGHANYGGFDLLSRHYWRVPLSRRRTWLIAVTSYAFNLNLGSLLGGAALRWRLFVGAGRPALEAARVFGLSVFSNWLGYAALTGGVLAFGATLLVPAGAGHGPVARRVAEWVAGPGPAGVGSALLAAVLAYLLAVALMQGRRWRVHRQVLPVPRPGWVALQLGVGVAAWLLTAAVPWVLLQAQVPYPRVLATHLLASIVVVAARIPGGLGVLEAVYLAVLAGAVPSGALLGALVLFRVLYYLVPLAWASAAYLWLERHPAPAPALPTVHKDKDPP